MKTRTKRSRAAVWGIVACCWIVWDANAWAQEEDGATPAPSPPASAQAVPPAVQEAERRYEAGIRFVQGDKWAEAREEFRQAYAASAQPKYLAALIKAEIATGQEPEAATHLVMMLRRKSELDAETRSQAEEKLAELRKKLGTAIIKVNVPGAEVLVDGVVVGTSPMADEVFVGSGRRTFQARKAGFVTAESSVEVAAGSKPTVALELKKAEPPKPVGSEKDGGPNKGLIYAGAAVAGTLAVVGVGTAVGAAVARQKRDKDWDDANCTAVPTAACYKNFDEQEKKRFRLGNAAFWTFIGATAIGGGTLVYALVAAKPERAEQKQGVCVEPTLGGITVRGTF